MCQINNNVNNPMNQLNNNKPLNALNNNPFSPVNASPVNANSFANALTNLVQNPQTNSQPLLSLLNIVVQLIQGLQAQPQQGFGAPAGQPNQPGFGTPAGQPTMPQQGFGVPAGQPTMPQPGFDVPAGQPNMPQQGFGAPAGQPTMPQQGFGTLTGQPTMPQQGFGAPAGQPTMPQPGFGAPAGFNHITNGINQNIIAGNNNGVINQEVNPNNAGGLINNNVNTQGQPQFGQNFPGVVNGQPFAQNPAQPNNFSGFVNNGVINNPAHPQPVDPVAGQNLPGVANQDQPFVGGRHIHDQNNLFGNTLGGQVGNAGPNGPKGGDNTVTNGDGLNQTAIVEQNNGVINQIVINNYYVYPGADMPKFNGPASPLAPQPGQPAQPAQPALDPVEVKPGAKAWGDPHFVGAEGGRYDIKGDNKSVYNLLSDKGIQVNSTFDNNLMQDYGVTLGNNQVSFDKAGTLTINGEKVKDGDHLDGAVSKKGKTVSIKSGEYDLSLITRGNYMDIEFGSKNVAADGVMPHGFWGQTADGDGKARKGSGWDGTGAIEKLDGTFAEKGDKTYQLYEVNDIFDVNFQNFNKFWGETQPTVVPANVAAQGGAQ